MSRHIPRLYTDNSLDSGQTLELSTDKAHHLLHVLRIRKGDPVCLFNGRGGEYAAEVICAERHSVSVKLLTYSDISRESPLHIVLAQGIARGERMDFAIQKAVELGVGDIQPLHTEKSQKLPANRLRKKQQHWRAVACSAAEQAGRTVLPEVHAPEKIADWLAVQARESESTELLLLDPTAETMLKPNASTNRACLLVGPESGLSEPEYKQARESGFQPIRLGPRTLRTETAGLAAITAVQMLWGDLNTRPCGTGRTSD